MRIDAMSLLVSLQSYVVAICLILHSFSSRSLEYSLFSQYTGRSLVEKSNDDVGLASLRICL